MIYSLHGKIVDVQKDRVAIDLGTIGYEVFVSHPEDFSLGMEALVYTAEVQTQDDHYLVGFLSKAEKLAFLALTDVKGIGAKTAISALSKTTPESLFAAIETSNANYLKKLPGIGPKAASQIILDLKGKLVETTPKSEASGAPDRYPGVVSALRGLGYKAKESQEAVAAIKENNLPEGEALRLALQYLSKARKSQ